MSGKKSTEAWDRTLKAAEQLKPVADQVRPLAKSAGQAARRNLHKTRAWAAPQVERTGQALQDTVAPKVASALASAAQRIDPAQPKHGKWRLPVGIAAAIAAAASAAAAVIRGRKHSATAKTGSASSGGSADSASSAGSAGSADSAGSANGSSPDQAMSDHDGETRAH
ncbi:MAG TPA: hypothetical protein VMR14_21265 [Streptosporangiaceae bacterium]|jgi:hypothetical protein|nr:hypothetical protein [Streptosporangiaceae bacterium]